MAIVKKGVMMWRGTAGGGRSHIKKSVLMGVSSLDALHTFEGVIDGYSNCILAGNSWNQYEELSTDIPADPASVNVKAVLFTRDSADGSIVRLSLFAPDDTLFSDVDAGIVDDTVGATVATAMSTATGKTFGFLFGRRYEKPAKRS